MIKKIIIFLTFILTPCCLFAQVPSLPEEIRITTYFPSPYGSYRQLESRNSGEEINLGLDANSPSIELRDTDGGGNQPHIDFATSAAGAGSSDMQIILDNANLLRVTGGDLRVDGDVRFTEAAVTTVDPLNAAPYAVVPRYKDSSDTP